MYIMKSNKPKDTKTNPDDFKGVRAMTAPEMINQEQKETLLENRILREENQRLRGQVEYYKASLSNLQSMAHAIESTVVISIVGGNAHGN
jgi:hypothetical protein